MISYTRLNVNVITFVITIVLFLCINSVGSTFNIKTEENNVSANKEVIRKNNTTTKKNVVRNTSTKNNVVKNNTKNTTSNNNKANNTTSAKVNKLSNTTLNKWEINIPTIGLIAPIAEGTSNEVMNQYVGHFEITSTWKGNIGLAAHNRRISCKLFC